MKTTLLWVLAVLNVALLAMFLSRGHENAAMAQGRVPAAGSYLAVPGEVVGGGAGGEVVYILDTRNNILTAVQQGQQGQLTVMKPIDLSRLLGH